MVNPVTWDTVEEGKKYEVRDPERVNKTIPIIIQEKEGGEIFVQRVEEFPIQQVDAKFMEEHPILGEIVGGRRTRLTRKRRKKTLKRKN